MALDFNVKDIMHNITVKFTQAFLPEAKKAYYLKAVNQTVLTVHDLASKADVYNITTSPKIIEEGMTAGFELAFYLLADGFRISTPMFNANLRLPGEYDGSETHLPDGTFPQVRFQTSAALRKYIKDHVTVKFDSVDESEGMIAQAIDEATGLVDTAATIGNILTLHGYGLKIESDAEHKELNGIFFVPKPSGVPIKAKVVAVNEPRTIKVLVPAELEEGKTYQIAVETQSSAKNGAALLKKTRDVRSDFIVTAQK